MAKTILVTGGAGFIGSHLADALLARGYRVLAIDDLSTGRLSNIEHLFGREDFHFARASIMDEIVLDRMASESDIVVHLAAAVGVQLIVQRPVHTIETNVMGTEVVLRAALRYRCRVLLASTSEVYGKGSRIPFAEEDDVLLGATDTHRWAYAASKMLDEFLGLAYVHEYGLEVVPFRLFNTVGPRQTGHYGMVIPRLMKQALRGEPLTVYGDGTQSRCFCDVEDVITALLILLERADTPGRLFNVGSTEEVTILELAERIRRVAKTAPRCASSHTPRHTGRDSRTCSAACPTRRACASWRAGNPRVRSTRRSGACAIPCAHDPRRTECPKRLRGASTPRAGPGFPRR
jgi:UDP-glucose 4-epimerase